MKTVNWENKVIASFDFGSGVIMGNGTIQGYRGYTIWTKLHRDKWYVFFRCAHSTVSERVTQPFEDEQFGIRVAQIIINNRLGLPASAA